MNDRYMFHTNVVNRLVEEYRKHGSIIVAYDYDGTVHDYHNQGDTYSNVISLIKELKPYAKFIVYTCSPSSRYDEISNYLDVYGIPFDVINQNIIELNNNQSSKLYYNVLIDDRAGLESVYFALTDFIKIVQEG